MKIDQQHASVGISPHGSIYCLSEAGSSIPERIQKAFELGAAHGLLQLGLSELATDLSPDLGFFREFARLFFSHLCAQPGISEMKASDLTGTGVDDNSPSSVALPPEELKSLADSAPPMLGLEYLNAEFLSQLWQDLFQEFCQELSKTQGTTVRAFFETHGATWNLVGRVCFHLAENKANPDAPFAFLATYSHRLSDKGKAQHLPLGRALQEYAGEKKKTQLLQLLLPVQKASQNSAFLKERVDSGEIFHPLAWIPEEAFRFLKDIPIFESSGVVVRVPDWWKAKRPPRPQVSVTVGGAKASTLGLDAMLEFSVKLTIEGETLTEKELKQILSNTNGLALIRGKWVEIDREKLKQVLDHWKSVEREASGGGISFIEGMRLLSGASIGGDGADLDLGASSEWSQVAAGDWLSEQLNQLREPDGKLKKECDPGSELRAILRPYQRVGVQWLWLLHRLGLGGCLADDMGLGKTIQMISLFLLIKNESQGKAQTKAPSLLVVPASLLGNWKSEIERFAPSLRFTVIHPAYAATGPSTKKGGDPAGMDPKALTSTDVVITTYGYLSRLPWLAETQWNLVVIDEAQAIKNSGSKQTRAVKVLKSRHRIALTGTPIENRLSDLWSLYDFLCPGLLGSAKEFERFVKAAEKSQSQKSFGALRNLIRPYLLRRLKTDKKIISDLPEKTELQAFCGLTKTQAALYQQSVEELAEKIEKMDGMAQDARMQRRGVVLSFLMRFKQICNHPSQWLSDGRYQADDSGKFARLREICEEIAAKQEKVLVFTQFREITGPISRFLTEVFGREGLVLHGETSIKKRKELVDQFQNERDERGPPFFVLSLKAGGIGLNLTSASHVIHFDRWWNPAIENQATDRAYRIGQRKNVLVHKFVCRGTIEEKIDTLLSSKQALSKEILEGGAETLLTELSNQELLKLVSLDIRSATEEI